MSRASPERAAAPPAMEDDSKQAIATPGKDMPANGTSSAESEHVQQNTSTEVSIEMSAPTETAHPASPNSKKRALPDASTAQEPESKKVKESPPSSPIVEEASAPTFPSPPDYPATQLDKETWQGFCDIESEPAYFSVILREAGVQGVTVREVFAMTPDLLEMLPQPIYGLILLFRYREFGKEDQASDCPSNVWFANQLPGQNSCGTLAMVNILMNNPEVQVGEHLQQFKDFTKTLTPYQRGEAFASFDYIKKIHNSFAKKMDLLENDKYLSYKVKRSKFQKDKDASISATKSKPKPKTTSRSRTSRRQSADSAATDDSADGYESNAHHFIAFVPVGTEVWKLDGMDAQPTSIGSFSPDAGETWLSGVSDTIATLMAAGDDDYGVVALTQSPLVPLRRKACLTINTLTCIEKRLDVLSPTWKSFVTDGEEPTSPRMLGLESDLIDHPVSPSTQASIDGADLQDLLDRRRSMVSELSTLAGEIMQEMETEAQEDAKATQRRYDCGPAIKKWLEMLAENGYLEKNLDRFMGKNGGR
ncbi:ubiquitin carboxyl-terminal hydrolase 2 [Paraphoma chrysanthemicola]|uniref:Ubiquitin carboxyl-terminal hydrolase n=1 Tax=Paraphoma chrysanthemicola TaxID=798071 RepID=A0A8K0RIX1_9PLEO|nr:ubiquitin carboxyl-terminal hydrolase 2 [Paraphoma chrysanthemicola]